MFRLSCALHPHHPCKLLEIEIDGTAGRERKRCTVTQPAFQPLGPPPPLREAMSDWKISAPGLRQPYGDCNGNIDILSPRAPHASTASSFSESSSSDGQAQPCDAFATSADVDETRARLRDRAVADRKLRQEARILQYATNPERYASASRQALRASLDEQVRAQESSRAEARHKEQSESTQALSHAIAADATYEELESRRSAQLREVAEANRLAAAERRKRTERQRAEDDRLYDGSFECRFGTSLR